MFDIATRPQPQTAALASVLAVPFDWRLTPPLAASSFPFTDYSTPTALPVAGVQVLATYALALEDTLATAVVLSLFTDRRAGRDDVLRPGQTDRRGWVGDEFMGTSATAGADPWGSALWLLYASKHTADVLERARFAADEALAWMVRDGLAERVSVTAQWVGEVLAVRPTIYAPAQPAPVYDVLWSTGLQRWALVA